MRKIDTLEDKVQEIWLEGCGQAVGLSALSVAYWHGSAADYEYNFPEGLSEIYLERRNKTIKLIKKYLTLALVSPSPYIRRYAELISKEKIND